MKKSKQYLLRKQNSTSRYLKSALVLVGMGLIGTRLTAVALHADNTQNALAESNCTTTAADAASIATPAVAKSDAATPECTASIPTMPMAKVEAPVAVQPAEITSAPTNPNCPTPPAQAVSVAPEKRADAESNLESNSLYGQSILTIRNVERTAAADIQSDDAQHSAIVQAQYVLTPLPFQQKNAEQKSSDQQPEPQYSQQQDSEQPAQGTNLGPQQPPLPAQLAPEPGLEAQSVLDESRAVEQVAQQPAPPLPPMPVPQTPAQQTRETILAPQESGKSATQAVVVDVQVKPISTISLNLVPPPADGKIPFDLAASAFAQHGEVDVNSIHARNWSPWMSYWQASEFCHNPLYFEEPNLERYGHWTGCDCTQSALSGAHFFATIPLLPYKVVRDCPCCCNYTLGHSRPGNCNAWEPHW